eukprot:355384-Chlamydomonas_euryale.AAC.2
MQPKQEHRFHEAIAVRRRCGAARRKRCQRARAGCILLRTVQGNNVWALAWAGGGVVVGERERDTGGGGPLLDV